MEEKNKKVIYYYYDEGGNRRLLSIGNLDSYLLADIESRLDLYKKKNPDLDRGWDIIPSQKKRID
ncbi:hypothetical protein NZD48_08995 [Staphylococcus hyicus]|uniref:hypothetical protein n=1 Tax=Staphylococcus hyicus TaxID=1284 RepID=UPI00217E8366|nr:hypothetical protein [Staphylococcus hyicus]UWF56183.1 hypothetical protein NZD48_08995 [Staphylococcus hyicus]